MKQKIKFCTSNKHTNQEENNWVIIFKHERSQNLSLKLLCNYEIWINIWPKKTFSKIGFI